MKYTCTVDINLPIEKVVELWEDEANFKEWQDDFESITHTNGTPHTKDAQAEIIFNGKMKIELLETIMVNNLPEEKTALYEHKHMTNTQSSSFEKIEENRTRYTSVVEYTKFNGFAIKTISKLFPSKFKAQSQKWMDQFKVFAEKQN